MELRQELIDTDDDNTVKNKREYVKCPELNIKLNNICINALLDTGSSINVISEAWYLGNKERLGKINILPLNNTTVRGAVGAKSTSIKKQILLNVTINNFTDDVVFLIIPGLNHNCIIGMELLKSLKCIIDLKNNQLKFDKNNKEECNSNQQIIDLMKLNINENVGEINFENAVKEILTVDEVQKQRLIQILSMYATVFRDEPGRINGYEQKIEVTDTSPFFQRIWPIPLAHREKVEQEIQRMLRYKIIERSSGPYINPLVVVVKKDQSIRLCLDARKINTVIKPQYEGSTPINEILASCSGTKIMSSIDLRHSFWQVPLNRESRDYTGFMYNGRIYRFTVTPFGLKTSSASLARALDIVLSEEVKRFTLIYVDDCLVISKSIEEHLHHLELLLKNLKEVNITVNFAKSQLFRKEINYLGYRISTEGISTDRDKVSTIINFPRPRNHKQLKAFLGLTNFYNRFTSKYAATTQPLLQLLKKDRRFRWTTDHEHHFESVKQLFVEAVVLKYPDHGKQYYLQTDASNYALGGQLYQYDNENNIAVIAFTSRTFKGAELNYHTTEKELLSILHCLNKFRIYLMGRKFTIITDNKALTFLNKCYLSSSRMTRWILAIQEFDFTVQHCKGRDNVVADVLSRYPEDADSDTDNRRAEFDINKLTLKISKEGIDSLKNIAKLQNNDPKTKDVIDKIQSNETCKYKNKYLYHKKILYRDDKGKWKLYIPENMRLNLINDIHVTYGHGGIKRTIQVFKESFATDRLIKTTKAIIRGCDLCQRCKDHHHMCHGETKAILPKERGELISADFYGPLVTSTSGVRYVLVMVDNFTKFVRLYALKRATTYITLRKIKEYCEQYGPPRAILTDNGSQFATELWRNTLAALNIKTKYTAIRNPCTNVAERINRQLGNLFRIFMRESHTGWARHLPLIELCINETYHETIGMTPHEAQYGEKPQRSWTKFIDQNIIKNDQKTDPAEIYLRIKEKRQKAADKENQRTKFTTFEVEDKVLLRTSPRSDALNKVIAKFCDLYEGPYVVKERIGPATYLLAAPDEEGKIRGKFNVRQLKPYFEGTRQ